MPDLLERAYSGLEAVNETHRTNAVLKMLSAISYQLVTWRQSQRHVVPLLEMALPGIDLVGCSCTLGEIFHLTVSQNDPGKTLCATAFINDVTQHIMISDLSTSQSGIPSSDEATEDDGSMEVDSEGISDSNELGMPQLDPEEEKGLVRDSTAAFAGTRVPTCTRCCNL